MRPHEIRPTEKHPELVRVLKFLNVLLLGITGGVALVTHDLLALLLFVAALLVAALLEALSL